MVSIGSSVGFAIYLFPVVQALIVILQDRSTGFIFSWFLILVDNVAGEVFLPEGEAA
jgi:hypothetical protein